MPPKSTLSGMDQAYLMGIGQSAPPPRQYRTPVQRTADILGAASIPMSGFPLAGDVFGLAADAAMYAAYPEERTWGNYALSALGALPLVPGVSALKALENAPSPSVVDTSYRGSHTPPDADYGAPLHDLTKLIPADVYGPNGARYYGIGDRVIDSQTFAAVAKAKGNPDAMITVYRAVPKNVGAINPGDWVTTSKKYADMHGDNALRGDYKILESKVRAKELLSEGYPYELGWNPTD